MRQRIETLEQQLRVASELAQELTESNDTLSSTHHALQIKDEELSLAHEDLIALQNSFNVQHTELVAVLDRETALNLELHRLQVRVL